MASHSIYRYKLSEDIMSAITDFSKIHQHDDRKDYKEAWEDWCDINNDLIDTESRRLEELGYEGDLNNKMYKAGRYYFRTKNTTDTIEPKERRVYVSMNSDVIEQMDDHIVSNMKSVDYSPAQGYSTFCQSNIELLREEIIRLSETGMTEKDIVSKIKKTYKNRYFIITRND